ncbi:hypothetical protein GCM10029964_001250 [Kibdelosporangium lantanae]
MNLVSLLVAPAVVAFYDDGQTAVRVIIAIVAVVIIAAAVVVSKRRGNAIADSPAEQVNSA